MAYTSVWKEEEVGLFPWIKAVTSVSVVQILVFINGKNVVQKSTWG